MALNTVHRTVTQPAEGLGTTPITFAASTAQLIYSPARPVRIVRWGAILTTAPAGTGPLQFRGDVCPVPVGGTGSGITTGATVTTAGTGYNSSNAPTFYVDTAGGTLTLPAASFSSVVASTYLYHNVNPQAAQTGGYYPAPDTALIPPGGVDTQLVIYPGQSFRIFTVTVGSSPAGAGILFLELEELALTADFNNNPMVLSGYPSANGTIPTPSFPFPVLPFNGQS